ncbi:MAG: sacsin N-terminal ATP-binding-like domain-containing protein [Chitinophagales bacterium]
MIIKNIPQFRTNWKNEQGYEMSTWDEHFIGSTHAETNGFYKMVNGIVNNIKADLKPKLQNAQDTQAIYEFLQNAADSHSTECAVIYDENYFMVVNNGKPFSTADIKAILNSFQGTKADKTKAKNCHKIGRYGIGFKLAYRLTGKSDGVDELLEQMAGPILFSWHNKNQFNDLYTHKTTDELQYNSDFNTPAAAPWLMKIILACFPSAPSENVKNLGYEDKVVFPKEELGDLVGFLHKHKEQIEALDLHQGSLFFLKFGERKHEKLKNSLENIKSGIGYSMNTLKTLNKVVLQDEIVEELEIDYEEFSIEPNTPQFKKIDPEFPFCPIRMVFGYQTENRLAKRLKDAPNLYQFFPMRNERHNLAFFVHSTSFAKVTDRTRLDDLGEANFETFKYLVTALQQNLNGYKSDKLNRFANIFKAILLSDKSDNGTLINDYLYEPLLGYIRNNIPTNKGNFYPKDIVVVKNTRLSVEPMALGIGKEWFYWANPDTDKAITNEAAKVKKLNLTTWNLKDLLLEGNVALINNWITQLSNEEYGIFVTELKDIEFDAAFAEKFHQIQCFKFTDSETQNSFYAIDDFKNNEDVLLVNETIEPAKDLMRELGYSVLEFDLSDYNAILKGLEGQEYLHNEGLLFEKIVERTANNTLTHQQRKTLFDFLANLKGVKREQLREVVLFSDQNGVVRSLKSLLPKGIVSTEWLKKYEIHDSEFDESLTHYLANEESIYGDFMAVYWEQIIENKSIQSDIEGFYKTVTDYYKGSKQRTSIAKLPYIYINPEKGFVTAEEVFFHKAFWDADNYDDLQSALQQVGDFQTPHPDSLAFLNDAPFRTAPVNSRANWRKMVERIFGEVTTAELNPNEKQGLFQLLLKVGVPQKQMATIALFTNKAGEHKPLNTLLASDAEVEEWLEDYKIHVEEEEESLQNFLLPTAEIYAEIILPNWHDLLQQPKVLADIPAFYQAVQVHFANSRSSKALTNLNYIFAGTEQGFLQRKTVFFHKALEQNENYGALATALQKLTELSTPQVEILPLLLELPFKTNENRLQQALKPNPVLLSETELKALLEFVAAQSLAFFSFLYMEESEEKGMYFVGKKGSFVQCFAGDKRSKLYLTATTHLPERYKFLPPKFYNSEANNKGLLEGKQLYNELIKSVDAEALSAIVAESGDTKIQAQFLKRLPELTLKAGQVYDKSSSECNTLQLFRNKEVDVVALRKKITLEDADGNSYNLGEVCYPNMVSFKVEQLGQFKLVLSEVLPRFAPVFVLMEELVTQFPSSESALLRKMVFNAGEELPYSVILGELRRDYRTLSNAPQLAFALLMNRASNISTSRMFKVKTQGENTVFLYEHPAFYLQSQPFLQENAVLSEDYAAITDLLKLDNEKRPAFAFNDQHLFIQPFLWKNTFYLSSLQSVAGEDLQNQREILLEYMYQQYLSSPTDSIELEGFSTIFGFDALACVYPEPYALQSEMLPEWALQWTTDKEQSIDFLGAMGVNTHDSALVRFRQFLQTGEGEISRKDLNYFNSLERNFHLQSLQWAASQHLVFEGDAENTHWLRILYNTIEDFATNTPLPYIVGLKGENFSYGLQNFEEKTLYALQKYKQDLLQEKYGIGLANIFEQMQTAERCFVDWDIKNLQLTTTKVTEALDLEQLQAASEEWTVNYYEEWKQDAPFQIFLFDGEMPHEVQYLDTTMQHFASGNAVLHENEVYVNRHAANIEEELLGISKTTTGLTQQYILELLRLKNEVSLQNLSEDLVHTPIQRVIQQTAAPEWSAAYKALVEHLSNDENSAVYELTAADLENEHEGTLTHISKGG